MSAPCRSQATNFTSPSSSASSSHQVPERKKRLACDACHVSKVRCTSEPAGCQRCQRRGEFCHYSESNMGRTIHPAQRRHQSPSNPKSPLGNDARTPVPSLNDLEPPFEWDTATYLDPSTSSSNSQVDPFSSTINNAELDRLVNESMALWNNGSKSSSQHHYSSVRINRAPTQSSTASTLELDDEGVEAWLSMDTAEFSPLPASNLQPQCYPSRSTPHHSYQQTHRPTDTVSSIPHHSGKPHHHQDLSEAFATDLCGWTSTLEQLSHPPNPSPMPLDTLLHTTSNLLPRAHHSLRNLPQDTTRLTPLVIILLCLNHIIALFEQCLPVILHEGGGSGARRLPLCLGIFQVDDELQQALQKHLFRRELARMLYVVNLARQVLRPSVRGPTEPRSHAVIADELLERIKNLRNLV